MCINFVHVTNAANHYATPPIVDIRLRPRSGAAPLVGQFGYPSGVKSLQPPVESLYVYIRLLRRLF